MDDSYFNPKVNPSNKSFCPHPNCQLFRLQGHFGENCPFKTAETSVNKYGQSMILYKEAEDLMNIIKTGNQEIKDTFVYQETNKQDFIQSLLKNKKTNQQEVMIPSLIGSDNEQHACLFDHQRHCQSCFQYKLSAKKKSNVDFSHYQIGDRISICFHFDLSHEELCYLEKMKPKVKFFQVKNHRYLKLETCHNQFESAFVLKFKIIQMHSR